LCDNDDQGIKALLSAMSNLISLPVPENRQSDSVVENDTSETKPILLWRALYVQELVKVENVIGNLPFHFDVGNVIFTK
jgi:hypothetical protein